MAPGKPMFNINFNYELNDTLGECDDCKVQ